MQMLARISGSEQAEFASYAQPSDMMLDSAERSRLAEPSNVIMAREVDFRSIDRRSWNDFAEKCGASARSSYNRISSLNIKSFGRGRVRAFDVYQTEGGVEIKIGRCVGVLGNDGRLNFIDRLQLLPGYEPQWTPAMSAVIAVSGARHFQYGWQLNCETPRESDLASIRGVSVESVRPLVVHAVDFQRWASWDAYFRNMSENSRRNAKAALRDMPRISLLERSGRQALRSVPSLVGLRASMAERKSLDLNVLQSGLSYLGWIIFCPDHVVTGLAMNGKKALSAYFGIEFGENTYYLEGASRGGNGGAAWRLLIAMLNRAYARHPKGKFVMGYMDASTTADEGLLRSRAACRVSSYPTSVVRFSYDPS
jgi:hypothetical protein